MAYTKEEILEWLDVVKDPEIPVISLIDLGVIQEIEIDDESVRVEMTPTFAGCPAMDYMKNDVERVLTEKGVKDFTVNVSFKSQWNSDMISEKGRVALKEFGLAPPRKHDLHVDLDVLQNVTCPYCDSDNTELRTPFGPTLCRAMHYCNNCKQAFEQFKPVG